MRIAVTGSAGQLAMSLAERARAGTQHEVILVGRPQLDLLRPETIQPALQAVRPDIVVSAAAYTAVDAAEDDRTTAFTVNAAGAGAVAGAAAEIGVPVIHMSTDYVFEGAGTAAHTEDAATGPLNVYGASKLEGEHAVIAANLRHLIVRTAWVHSPYGSNFVRTMLRLAQTRPEIRVVADQWGNPTAALDLADAILQAAAESVASGFNAWGIYHLAGTGEVNWSGLAREIFTTSKPLSGPVATVKDISTTEYPTRARRPANSRLSSRKFAETFGWVMPDWRPSVGEVVRRLLVRPL